jgi:hydroxyacylglutathione hydrolase
LTAISPAQLDALLREGHIALDVRPLEQVAAAHVPGSVNIALSGQFASWAGTVLGLSSNPMLIADTPEQIAEARLRLARVGIENLAGELAGGLAAWKQAGFPAAEVRQISVETLDKALKGSTLQVLDVRRKSEWQAGHIEGAAWWPLDNFKVSPPEMNHDAPIAVHCKGGYRGMIACSLLQRAGFQNVVNVMGGFDAWQQAQLPVAIAPAQEVKAAGA